MKMGWFAGVIITEHCDGGLLSDVVTQNYPQTFSEKLILAILRDLCCALFTLHTADPPISHRNVNVGRLQGRSELAELHLRRFQREMQTRSGAFHDVEHDRTAAAGA